MSGKKQKHDPGDSKSQQAQPKGSTRKLQPSAWFDWHPGNTAVIATLTLAVLICYGSSIAYDFVHDDRFEVLQNPLIQDLTNAPRFFAMTAWGFQENSDGTSKSSNYYRPLQYITYSVLYSMFGFSGGMFHAFKLLLHLVNAFLVFWILDRLGQPRSAALVLALLFVVNPANSEAVLWISAVTDVACASFFLLSCALYLKFRSDGTWPQILAFGLCILAGLFFKETMIAVIPLLAVYEFLPATKPIPPARKMLFLGSAMVAAFIYIGLRWHAMGGLVTSSQLRFDYLSPIPSLVNQVILLIGYLRLFFFPSYLNAFHVFHPALSPASAAFLVSASALVILGGLGLFGYRRLSVERRNLLVMGCAWFLLSIAPVIVFFKRIGVNVFAERYIYIPSIGLCMVTSVLLWSIWDRWKPVFSWVIPLLLLLAAGRTMVRADVWRDDGTFLEITARQSPDAEVIHENIGIYYARKHQWASAEASFRKAIAVGTPSASHYVNLGNVLASQNRFEEAAPAYEQVMRLRKPRDLDYVRLGQTYDALKRYDQVVLVLQSGVGFFPRQPLIQFLLGNALLNLHRYAEAKLHLEAARELSFPDTPKLTEALDALNTALAKNLALPKPILR